MSITKTVYLTDLNASQTDQVCPRRFWLREMEAGCGIVNKEEVIPSQILAQTQEDLRVLAGMADISAPAIQAVIDDILSGLTSEDRQNTKRMEILYRRVGWLAAFALYVEPIWREAYDTLDIADEVVLDRDPLFVSFQPGRVLRSKDISQDIIYREFVPMEPGLTHRLWMQGWHYNPRLHLGITAVEEQISKAVTYGEVVGLDMGHYSIMDTRLIHPFVWGYHNPEKQEWAPTIAATGGKPGAWKSAPVWEFPGGVVAWVKMVGEYICKRLFPMSPPVFLKREVVDSWCGERLHRERLINGVKSTCHTNFFLRDVNFPKRTEHCRPATGEACSYLKACWSGSAMSFNPLKSKEFIPNLAITKALANAVGRVGVNEG